MSVIINLPTNTDTQDNGNVKVMRKILTSNVVGTTFSQVSRKVGTTIDLFGLSGDRIMGILCVDTELSPGAILMFGSYDGDFYIGATQTCTMVSTMELRILYV